MGACRDATGAKPEAQPAEVFEVLPRLEERFRQLAGSMSSGRGLMAASKLMVIGETLLGLSQLYVKANFNVIPSINDQGIAVLPVEQNVKQTPAIAHRGQVLSQGRVAAAGDADQFRENPEVRAAYFGSQWAAGG